METTKKERVSSLRKERKRKKPPGYKGERTHIQPIKYNKGNLDILHLDPNKAEDFAKLKSEMLSILPGFASSVLFNAGTMRKTLFLIDKAKKELRLIGANPDQFRFGKAIFNGQNKFKGLVMHRYNIG